MVLNTGVVASYNMSSTADNTGNGHNLTNYGATFVVGKNGNAVSFNGTLNQYLTIPVLNLPTTRTFNCWVKISSSGNNIWGLLYGYSINKNNVIFGLPGSKLGSYQNTGYISDPAPFSYGVWVMITRVYSGDGKINIYKNGVQVAYAGFYSVYTDNNINFIGRHPIVANQGTIGAMDELTIWNRALTSIEITQLYNSGTGLYYPFSTGYSKKVNGVTVSKVNGIPKANIGKVNGI